MAADFEEAVKKNVTELLNDIERQRARLRSEGFTDPGTLQYGALTSAVVARIARLEASVDATILSMQKMVKLMHEGGR